MSLVAVPNRRALALDSLAFRLDMQIQASLDGIQPDLQHCFRNSEVQVSDCADFSVALLPRKQKEAMFFDRASLDISACGGCYHPVTTTLFEKLARIVAHN